jgi:hypothetical protein
MADLTVEQRLQRFEDIQAIHKLKADYCHACDGGWDRPTHDYDKVASLFVEEGSWDARPTAGFAEGREAIRELFKTFRACPFAVHYVTNPQIEVDGDTATGNWHLLLLIVMPENRQALYVMGIYNDEFVRTPEGWRFKTLRFTPAAFSPYELGWGKAQFAPQE